MVDELEVFLQLGELGRQVGAVGLHEGQSFRPPITNAAVRGTPRALATAGRAAALSDEVDRGADLRTEPLGCRG